MTLLHLHHYVVQPGDTLSAIALRAGTTWRHLWAINQKIIINPDLIYPGWRISLTGHGKIPFPMPG